MTTEPTGTLPIILLAAGNSSRMRGADKLLECIEGEPLLRRQAKAARAATSGLVIVTLPTAPHPRYATLQGIDVLPLPVAHAASGMSHSLIAGLNALPDDTPAAMILLADLPELTSDDLVKVMQSVALDGDTLIWRGTSSDGAPGHPIVFHGNLFRELHGITGDTGGAHIVAAHRSETAFVSLPDKHATRDLDTPEDWQKWRTERDGT